MISCQGLHLDINDKRVSLRKDPLGSPPPSICPKVCVTEFNLSIYFSHIYVVDFTPDDRFLLSGSADETVMIWSLETLFDDLENENENEKISNKHQSFSSLGQTFDQKFLDDNVSILAASDDNQTIRVSLSKKCNFIAK